MQRKQQIRSKKKAISQSFQETRAAWSRILVFLMCLFVIPMLSVIRSNTYYMEDQEILVRAGGLWHGRYGALLVGMLMSMKRRLYDVSPLSQILAALMMALSVIILIRLMHDGDEMETDWRKPSLWCEAVAMAPLFLFPYMTGVISHKYESIVAAAAYLAAVLPFLFHKSWKRFFLASLIGMTFVCTTYVASSGAYFVTMAFLAYHFWSHEQKSTGETAAFAGCALGAASAAALLCRLMPAAPMGTDVQYLPAIRELPGVFAANIREYYQLIMEDFHGIQVILMVVIFVCAFVLMIISSRRNKAVSFAAVLAIMLFAFAAVFGYYTFSGAPKTPANMSAFGYLLALAAHQMVYAAKRPASGEHSSAAVILLALTSIVLVWFFCSFWAFFGNELAEQSRFVEYQMLELTTDLNHMQNSEMGSRTISFEGDMGYSMPVSNQIKQNPLLKRLMPGTKANDSWNVYRQLYEYGLKNLTLQEGQDSPNKEELPVCTETRSYTIYGNDENVIVYWKTDDYLHGSMPEKADPK